MAGRGRSPAPCIVRSSWSFTSSAEACRAEDGTAGLRSREGVRLQGQVVGRRLVDGGDLPELAGVEPFDGLATSVPCSWPTLPRRRRSSLAPHPGVVGEHMGQRVVVLQPGRTRRAPGETVAWIMVMGDRVEPGPRTPRRSPAMSRTNPTGRCGLVLSGGRRRTPTPERTPGSTKTLLPRRHSSLTASCLTRPRQPGTHRGSAEAERLELPGDLGGELGRPGRQGFEVGRLFETGRVSRATESTFSPLVFAPVLGDGNKGS